MRTIIRNATIVNEGHSFVGSVVIEDEMIQSVLTADDSTQTYENEIDATGHRGRRIIVDEQRAVLAQ